MNQKLPKIAIVGYGAMGKEIEKSALAKDFHLTNIFEIDTPLNENIIYDFDVAIDFSFPDSVLENVKKLGKLKKNIVLGTTGWKEYSEEIKKIVAGNGIGLVYGSNFSVGMNMFFKIVSSLSKMLNNHPGYDISVNEIHHTRKKDSPSGTALSIADIILKELGRKNKILDETSCGTIQPSALHVTSARVGEVTGTHTVYIDSPADTIELTHRAKNRSGFAEGALLAAEWINGKKGYFDFPDVLNDIWNKE